MIAFIILGIIQGVTEFFPVSSSGHLFIGQGLLEQFNLLPDIDLLAYFVFLHAPTLIAVIIFLSPSLRGFFKKKTILHVCFITLVSGIVGLTLRAIFRYQLSHGSILETVISSRYFISFCLFLNAAVLYGTRRLQGKRQCAELTFKDSFFIALWQGLAFFPGISRSGMTISSMLRRGFSRKESFALSFFMSIPLVVGANILEYSEIFASRIDISSMAAGFICALAFGLAALAFLKKIVINGGFHNFAYYCVLVAILILFI